METKVQKMYREALNKGDVVSAIKLLHYKPETTVTKEIVVVETSEAPVVKSKKKKSKK